MRELSINEIEDVSGGELSEEGSAAAILALMAICPTPPVIAVGVVGLVYIAAC